MDHSLDMKSLGFAPKVCVGSLASPTGLGKFRVRHNGFPSKVHVQRRFNLKLVFLSKLFASKLS